MKLEDRTILKKRDREKNWNKIYLLKIYLAFQLLFIYYRLVFLLIFYSFQFLGMAL